MNAQVWVKLQDLLWEYWNLQTLVEIVSCFRVLLRVYKATLDGAFGHFGRVLVEVDLSTSLPQMVGVEREGGGLCIDLLFENIPAFCKLCSSLGNQAYECQRNRKPEDVQRQYAKERKAEKPTRTETDKPALETDG